MVEADDLMVEAYELVVEADGLMVEADELVAEAYELMVEADELVAEADELVVEADELVVEADELVVDANELMVEAYEWVYLTNCVRGEPLFKNNAELSTCLFSFICGSRAAFKVVLGKLLWKDSVNAIYTACALKEI